MTKGQMNPSHFCFKPNSLKKENNERKEDRMLDGWELNLMKDLQLKPAYGNNQICILSNQHFFSMS